MADISQGNRAELILNPGDVYRVSTGGTATVEAVYGAPAGTTTVTASTQDFGPYAANAKLIVRATSGGATYSIKQLTPITASGGVLDDPSRNSVVRSIGATVAGYKASLIGDSRTQDYYLSGRRVGGRSWISWANAYMGGALEVIAEYATSGFRSDQFFAESNFGVMLNDGANIAVVGYPFVNDVSQAFAGYTDVDGNAVTLANVQSLVMARHLDRVQRLVSAGKLVIVCVEPGSSTLNASQVAVIHSINAELRERYRAFGAVKLFDPLSLVWSKSTTATAIAFNTGFSTDGTHATTRQGQRVGKYAAEKFFPSFLPIRKSYGVDVQTSSAQLYPNAGYSTATGGTTSNISGTDPLPANITLAATSAGVASYTATIADAEDGTGKELTLNITATGAVEVRVNHTGIPTAGLLYTDRFVGGCDCTVISASGCRVYGNMQLFTGQGTEDGYALYGGDAADVWLVTGSTGEFRLQSDAVTPPAGSSTGLAPQWRVIADFKAAGSCVIKLKDPTVYRK